MTPWRAALLTFIYLPAAASAQTLIDGPYVSIFELEQAEYSPAELKSLRSEVEDERHRQIDNCRNDEKRLRDDLQQSRKKLRSLDGSAIRAPLHSHITAVQQLLQNRTRECNNVLPATFDMRLAKARLLESWPKRRREIERDIAHGRAPLRKHGDVEDIGYRKIADDQEKDIPLGEQAIGQMISPVTANVIQDEVVQLYVRSLAEKIARRSDLKVPLHAVLLDSTERHAIGLPGGFLIVTSGLLRACETESQFAGALAPQIARMAARQATRGSKRSFIAKMFVPVAQVAAGFLTGGAAGAGAYYGMNYGIQGMAAIVDKALVRSTGDQQKESDQLGIQYLWNAGYDPKGFIGFLDVSKQASLERLLNAFTEILYLPERGSRIMDSPEFHAAKNRLPPTAAFYSFWVDTNPLK